MARAARWLVKNNVATLRELLGAGAPGEPPRRLTVLGHSLGAGAAAVAAVLLREHFPSLRCVAFAAPPCLDLSACAACAPYLTSVVLHDDVIPRASLQNVEELRCRLQSIQWRDMAAADFAKSRAGQAATAVNVSLGTLEKHAGDAVRSFTGKDDYTFGDITSTLVSRGAETMARAMSAGRGVMQHVESGSGGGGGKGGTSGKVAAAAGAAGAAAAAVTKKFSGLTSSFSKRSTATSTATSAVENDAPASAEESTSDAAAAAAVAVATAAKPGMYHRIFAKNKDGKANAATAEESAEEAAEEETPYFFIPGKVYHLRRGPLGAGASAAHVAADSPTLCKIELSSSLIADHSLGEYGEALDTLAIRPAAPQLQSAPRVEVSGTLEWEAGGLQYSVGMSKWTSYEGCYILAHELCLKRPNRDGELLPIKLDLWGRGFSAERHEFKGKGPFGIKIADPGNKTTIRLYVPGGEEELGAWLAAIERCCQGLTGLPAPPPFAATPVAVL